MMRKIALGATALLLAVTPFGASSQNTSETYRQLNLFGEVFERVRADYVEEVTDQKLIESAINGMLTSLDPHSSYLSPKDFQDMQVQTKGEFGGLGIEVTMEEGLIRVVSPIDDTPAARAGVLPGDIITHLDGEPVLGLTLAEAVDKMRGPANTEIKLTIRRANKEPFDLLVKRDVIRVDSVRARAIEDIAYVRVTSFTEQTDQSLKKSIERLRSEMGSGMKGIILDLRNNPGGLLDQAIAISDAFLDKGEIVSTRGRHSDDVQRTNARPGDIAEGLPMVILINGGSASASEIVAGALQDHRRGILLGTRSFGKGSVQTIIPLPGRGAMRLTTARYYTPSGRSIQAKGIEPDITVEPARIEKLEQGELPHEEDLRGALSNDTDRQEEGAPDGQRQEDEDQSSQNPAGAVTPGATPSTENGEEAPAVPPQVIGDVEQDYQLARAVDLLRGLWLFNARATN
jgi:carboxyl-terminal processing protease